MRGRGREVGKEGGKIKGNLNEFRSTTPFAVTGYIVKFYKFNP